MTNQSKMTVEVLRYNPEQDNEPYLSKYEVPYDSQTSLLDALGYIKDELEPELSYRWSCRMAICGSCGNFHVAVFDCWCAVCIVECKGVF